MITTLPKRAGAATAVALGLTLGIASLAQAAPTPTGSPSASPATSAAPAATTSAAPASAASSAASAAAPAASTAAGSASASTSAAAPAPAVTGTPLSAQVAPAAVVPTTDPNCATTKTLTIFNFNDFHGRIEAAPALFTPVEAERALNPNNVMLLSAGDNIGASTFVSMAGDDIPTIQVLNDAGLQASSVGNHEFDGGFAKLRDEYIYGQNVDGRNPAKVKAAFPYLAANMTGVNPPIAPYTIINQNGVRVAVIGAEVAGLAGLVSPAGIQGITVSPEVAAVNKVADDIAAKGLADVVVAEVHNNIQAGFDKNVDVIFNGHTHETYANYTADNNQPVLQAGSYGAALARVDLKIGANNVICGRPTGSTVKPAATIGSSAVIQKIVADVNAAKAAAATVGNVVVGKTCAAITRGTTADGKPDNRMVESTLTDMVAQMFYDRLSGGDPNFIGMQNPGGTRADLPQGDITYAQANAVLPFANSLMTTQITGAQLKTVLEEQWQRDPATGAIPSRPYLQLGLSKNVSYTYDESRPEGSRITSITINGKPYSPTAVYTVGSGSFLITGGDFFTELGKGKNTTDTGKSDLSEWVEWLKATTGAYGTVCPTYHREAVTTSAAPGTVIGCTAPTTFTVGQPYAKGVQTDTLNFTNGAPLEKSIEAFVLSESIGKFPVTNGVATITLTAPAGGKGGPLMLSTSNGTTVWLGNAGIVVAPCGAGNGTGNGNGNGTGNSNGTGNGSGPGLANTGGR